MKKKLAKAIALAMAMTLLCSSCGLGSSPVADNSGSNNSTDPVASTNVKVGLEQNVHEIPDYEEWFITDYDCYVDGLYSKLGEYESLDELNYLASKLDEMDQSDYAKFQAAMEIGDYTSSLQEIINLTENLDCYEVYPDIHD